MQENKEHHRTGITEAIAEDAIHIMEGDEAIIHDPPESHRLSKTQHTFLTVRNIFVVIAGGLFILSMLHIEPIYHYWNILKFVAYILGAGAYGSEVIGLAQKPRLKGDVYAIHVRGAVCAAGVQLPSGKSLIKRIMERDG